MSRQTANLRPMPATTVPADLAPLLERIHDSPVQLVLEFTGAGSLALFWLHSLGGSSRTILEASDRYAPSSLIDAIGFRPDRFTGRDTSAALARVALARARKLAEPGTPVVGVSASATIATDRTKRGEHRAVVALAGPLGVQIMKVVLDKGGRDRAGEEELVSRLILSAVADGNGLLVRPDSGIGAADSLTEEFEPEGVAAGLAASGGAALLQQPDLTVGPADGLSNLLIVSGSFNPLHHGHLGLAAAASAHSGRPALFELPLLNADKPGLKFAEAQRRMTQFAGQGQLLLTGAPLFVDKARLFPGSTFVIGVDTAARLLDERFYGDGGASGALAELDSLGARFLVAGRKRGDSFVTVADIELPADHAHLFSELPDFRQDISSTELREQRQR